MANLKDIYQNIDTLSGSTSSISILQDYERVIDELDVYVYENWIDGELVEGPIEHRYWIECVFMWPENKMPNPEGGRRLIDYGCKVLAMRSRFSKVRDIKTPDDLRPGTKKGKIDVVPIWLFKIIIPKKLIYDINRGYKLLDRNKIEDILSQNNITNRTVDESEKEVEDIKNDGMF